MTEPTPAHTPSTSRDRSQVSGNVERSQVPDDSIIHSMPSMSGTAQVKIDWKTRMTTARKTSGPKKRWRKRESRRSLSLEGPGATKPASSTISRTSFRRWAKASTTGSETDRGTFDSVRSR